MNPGDNFIKTGMVGHSVAERLRKVDLFVSELNATSVEDHKQLGMMPSFQCPDSSEPLRRRRNSHSAVAGCESRILLEGRR